MTIKEAACVYIENSKGQVVLVNRRSDPNSFGLPGGKVDPGETSLEAAVREVFEETGLKLNPDDLLLLHKAVCKGEVDFMTYCYFLMLPPTLTIPGGIEEGINAFFGDPQLLIESSPFKEYNSQLLEHLK